MDIFVVDLMLVFALAVFLGILFRFVGLPSLVGQVLAGFIAGMSGLIGEHQIEQIGMLGTVGVTLLLFLVGLEMNFKEIKKTGTTVVKLFFVQTALLSALLFVFAFFGLKLNTSSSILFALAMTFSSTIVVVKMLSESKDLASFSGKLSLGVLLLQDILAIFVLVMMPGFTQGFSASSLGMLMVKLGVLFLAINVVGQYLILQFQKYLVKNNEDLVLLSLVWFAFAIYFSVEILGLSPEIGGLLAGISLSGSWGHFQIVSKVKTLRDIFLTLFFVLLGLEIGSGKIDWSIVGQLVLISMAIKFVVVELAGYLSGLSGKAAFSVSLNMTQISEFSLIVMAFGLSAGLWKESLVTGVTVAGLISMVLSTVLMHESSRIYKRASSMMPWLFRFGGKDSKTKVELKDHVVLLGGDRTGKSILSALLKNGEKVLVVDFNPEVVAKLKRKGEYAVFGDVSDPEIVDLTNMSGAKMIISTVKDINDSLSLLSELKQREIDVPTIVDAESAVQAHDLYDAGASYVIFPHFVSGLHLGQVMKKFENDTDVLKKYRSKQKETLEQVYETEF